MSIYTTSTLKTERITVTTIQRVFMLLKNIFVVAIPFAILLALCIRSPVYLSTTDMIGSLSSAHENIPNLDKSNASLFLLMFLPLFIQYPLFTLLLKIANDTLEKKHIDVKRSITYILMRSPRIIIAVLLGFTMTTIGLICFILPGLYFMSVFSMVLPSIAIRDMKLIASFKNSFKMIKGSAMYTLLTLTFVVILPQVVLHIIGTQIVTLISTPLINELLIVLSLSLLSISFCAGIIFLFNELNLRQQEWAIEQAKEKHLADTVDDHTTTQA